MLDNYKTDSSFFTYVKIPMSYIGIGEIRYWFQMLSGKVAKWRLIVDDELDEQRLDLKQREEYYPDTRVMCVVMNPWSRIRLAYTNLQTNNHPLACTDFDTFVKNLHTLHNMKFDYWWHPLSQQISWCEYITSDGTVKSADYIFKAENLDKEFQPIQEYFDCYEPLKWWSEFPKYKQYYTRETKKIVANLFAEDIERLKYKF